MYTFQRKTCYGKNAFFSGKDGWEYSSRRLKKAAVLTRRKGQGRP